MIQVMKKQLIIKAMLLNVFAIFCNFLAFFNDLAKKSVRFMLYWLLCHVLGHFIHSTTCCTASLVMVYYHYITF